MSARDEYGGLVTFDSNTTIVNDLQYALEVLNSGQRFAILSNFLNRPVAPASALAASSLRRHLNAGLRTSAVNRLAQESRDATRQAFAAVVGSARDRLLPVDPLDPMQEVIFGVITRFYFGPEDGPTVATQAELLLHALNDVFGNPFALPASVPSPANLRIRRRYRRLRSVVEPLVRDRLYSPADDLAALVTRSAADHGYEITPISNLLIGSLLAAQRVPAAASCWALHEITRTDRTTDLARRDSAYLRAALVESNRLYPPTWMLRRVSTMPVQLGGYAFPRGHNFLVSPFVIHRDPRLFADPMRWEPARWLGGSGDRASLLTFGRGLHLCPGRDVSHVILEASIQTVLEDYSVRNVSARIRPNPRTTLVPEGLLLDLAERVASPDAVGSRGGCVRPQVLDPLGEPLPRRLTRRPECLSNRGPRELS